MMKKERTVRIAVAVNLPDLGEATRALELAHGIREYAPHGWKAEITFLSHGCEREGEVTDAGFALRECHPRFTGVSFRDDLQTRYPNLIGTPELARELIDGAREALADLRPDLVLHGFWPPASIASRMLGIPSVCFISVPLHPDTLVSKHFLRDIPDPIKPLTYLPRRVRRGLLRYLPRRVTLNAPIFPQRNIRLGAEAAGWRGDPLARIWDMLRADLTIVNDLPDFYADLPIPENFRVTGPLFASSGEGADLDPEILRRFAGAESRPKIFCAMGSSPEKEQLLAAVTALSSGRARDWSAVIVVPPAICPLAEARRHAGGAENVYLTDAFVPALQVNALADAVVSHGGQGTVQTAIVSGTPIVGFGVQVEQQINLDHIAEAGAAIRLPINRWTPSAIRRAVGTVLADTAYRENARLLRQRYLDHDGRRDGAQAIWHWITHHVS